MEKCSKNKTLSDREREKKRLEKCSKKKRKREMEWNIERKREYKARARETETIECEMIGEDKGSKEKEEVWEGVWATLLTVFVMRQD